MEHTIPVPRILIKRRNMAEGTRCIRSHSRHPERDALYMVGKQALTYRFRAPRSTDGAMRYAFVAAIMGFRNLSLYLLLVMSGIPAVASVCISTTAQTVLSFRAFRSLAFRET